MWKMEPAPEFAKKLKKWPKKHRRERVAMLNNLDTVLSALRKGTRLEQVKRHISCVHGKYSEGLISVDQRGGGGGLKQTRLYLYPDEDRQVLYALTIGDKDSQSNDVKFCEQWIADHRKNNSTQ